MQLIEITSYDAFFFIQRLNIDIEKAYEKYEADKNDQKLRYHNVKPGRRFYQIDFQEMVERVIGRGGPKDEAIPLKREDDTQGKNSFR